MKKRIVMSVAFSAVALTIILGGTTSERRALAQAQKAALPLFEVDAHSPRCLTTR